MNSPSISLAVAVIPSLFTCSSKTGEVGVEAGAVSAAWLTAVAVERRIFTPSTGKMIFAWAMKYSMSEISASGSGSGGGAVPLISRDRLACCARVMRRLSR